MLTAALSDWYSAASWPLEMPKDLPRVVRRAVSACAPPVPRACGTIAREAGVGQL